MLGLFGGDKNKVRKLRLQFEDIRQRVLYKMNGYEQYSFGSAYLLLFDELGEARDALLSGPSVERSRLTKYVKQQAEENWRLGLRGVGIHSEGIRAGANALALHAIYIGVDGYDIAEALTLRSDIDAFKAVAEKFQNRG
jgi:hypothetical protein